MPVTASLTTCRCWCLLVLSTFVGAMIVPPLAGRTAGNHRAGARWRSCKLEIASGVVAIVGILLAAALWLGKRRLVTRIANSAPGRFLSTWWFHAWGFDWLYDKCSSSRTWVLRSCCSVIR